MTVRGPEVVVVVVVVVVVEGVFWEGLPPLEEAFSSLRMFAKAAAAAFGAGFCDEVGEPCSEMVTRLTLDKGWEGVR